MENSFHKYLTPSPKDMEWGIYLNVGGFAEILPETNYPPQGHPNGYDFTWNNGRVLNEYQINYITSGQGILETRDNEYPVSPGTIISLQPGLWHRYRPDPKTGWKENYIGFDGKIITSFISNEYMKYANEPVIYIGFQEKVLEPLLRIIEEIKEEKIAYQQVCSGLLIYMIGNIISIIRNKEFANTLIEQKILKARLFIRDNTYEDIDLPKLAADNNLSYSYFRTMFRKFTGISPTQYHLILKLQKAREMLISSNKSIKEISYELNFNSVYHFSKIFKQKMGVRPSSLRHNAR
jgi:AraC-like DNA-binding protein